MILNDIKDFQKILPNKAMKSICSEHVLQSFIPKIWSKIYQLTTYLNLQISPFKFLSIRSRKEHHLSNLIYY